MINRNFLELIPGPVFIFIAATLWALDGFIRQSLYSLPPIIIVFYEHAIGAALLSFIFYKTLKANKLSLKDWGLVALISLLSGLLGTLWFTSALVKVQFISLSVVYLLQKLQPLFAISTASVLLKERLHKDYWIWAIVALIAAFFLTFPGGKVNLDTGAGTAMAALLALGSAAAWGSSTTLSKIALKKHDYQSVTSIRFFLTTAFALIAVFLFNATPQLAAPTPNQFLSLLFIALSTGMVALMIYYKGLQKTPASVTTIIELTFPALVILMDGFINNSWLQWHQYLAAIILSFAMYKVARPYSSQIEV